MFAPERRAGELLIEMKASGKLAKVDNLKKGKTPKSRTMTSETLADLGVTPNRGGPVGHLETVEKPSLGQTSA